MTVSILSEKNIPEILWQTWKSKDIPNFIKAQSDSWKASNPQLKINLLDDEECSNFILEHFGEVIHELYVSLPQPIMRADFWRVAVVYVHGGYYSDLDIICNKNIKNFIDTNVDAVFIRELDNISNYFFGAVPKHPVFKKTLDMMINEMRVISFKDTQSFGMHPLHENVRNYYSVVGTDYMTTGTVQFLLDNELRESKTLIHSMASLQKNDNYESWRDTEKHMILEREKSNDILFFTTFNRNGYELYGKDWIKSFSSLANYYNKFHAKIFYEGFIPKETHPNITWVNYEDVITHHSEWKKDYLSKTQHSDYVRTMTVRFSHKAFVIQHILDTEFHDYLIWVDGDCIFKNTEYQDFPKSLLNGKFLACQVEHNQDLNHVESGLLIFKGGHINLEKFNKEFKNWYQVNNILTIGQPYDGFLIFKSLLTSKASYVDLNKELGGGIQSDPSMTFRHPDIKSKFIHNIGWTGKNQYANWQNILKRDEVYQKINLSLFGSSKSNLSETKKKAFNKLEKLKLLKK
jgi:hypothetical protein